jgi:DNA topoisomerase-1
VSVRMGRFGPFVQAGTKDDEEKPAFAGLRPGQKMDTITLDDALVLFQLPRKLGETPQGEPMTVAIGRFGPYIKYGSKYVSLKEPDDPYTVTRERAIEVIEAKKIADANRIIIDFGVDDIQVLNGRYGPYITDKQRNARIPKDRDPKTLTLEECRALLAAAPPRPARGRFGRRAAPAKAKAKSPADTAAAAAAEAPATGRSVTNGKPAPKAKGKAKARAKAKAKAKPKAATSPAAAPAKTAAPKARTKAKASSKAT